jgi:hypothetical protein
MFQNSLPSFPQTHSFLCFIFYVFVVVINKSHAENFQSTNLINKSLDTVFAFPLTWTMNNLWTNYTQSCSFKLINVIYTISDIFMLPQN